MKLAAIPIIAIDRTRPMTRIVGCSRAAPATASTLSSDIDTSAIDDLAGRLEEGLLRRRRRLRPVRFIAAAVAQIAPHLPADPEQEDAAGQQQADDLEKLDGDAGKRDAQDGGGKNADQDRLLALVGRQPRRGKTDDDGVVAGQHQVDEDDLQKRQQAGRGENFHDVTIPDICETLAGALLTHTTIADLLIKWLKDIVEKFSSPLMFRPVD